MSGGAGFCPGHREVYDDGGRCPSCAAGSRRPGPKPFRRAEAAGGERWPGFDVLAPCAGAVFAVMAATEAGEVAA